MGRGQDEGEVASAEAQFHSLVGQIRDAGSSLQYLKSQGHNFTSEGHSLSEIVSKIVEISKTTGNVCCKNNRDGGCFCTETENSCIHNCPSANQCPSGCSPPR